MNLLVLVSQFEIRALGEGKEGFMSYPAWHVIMTLQSVHCPFKQAISRPGKEPHIYHLQAAP